MDETGKATGRRAVIPPEIVKEVEGLPPEERQQRLRRYVEEHGEEVEPVDGWTPYGSKAEGPGEPSA